MCFLHGSHGRRLGSKGTGFLPGGTRWGSPWFAGAPSAWLRDGRRPRAVLRLFPETNHPSWTLEPVSSLLRTSLGDGGSGGGPRIPDSSLILEQGSHPLEHQLLEKLHCLERTSGGLRPQERPASSRGRQGHGGEVAGQSQLYAWAKPISWSKNYIRDI